ncbi:hypothetical protein V8E54_000770 [Elaphomyces granulatus]
MRLQGPGQRLTEYVNTKWEEMIHDWRAVILKEQQRSYQHSVENEWMVTQHRHRGMLFTSVNGFISQFALGSARAHGNLTITLCPHHLGKTVGTSLTVDDSNAHWNIRRGDLTSVKLDPRPSVPAGAGRRMLQLAIILQLEAEWGEDDAEDNEAEDNEADKANKDNGGRGGRGGGQGRLCVDRDLRVFIKQ